MSDQQVSGGPPSGLELAGRLMAAVDGHLAVPSDARGAGPLTIVSDAAGMACVEVPSEYWRVVFEAAGEAGARLDWLGGTDCGDATELSAHLYTDAESVLVRTRVAAGQVAPGVTSSYPGADWHQRETAEMLGITFDDGDCEALLLPHGSTDHPLRRGFPLTARVDRPWPGAAEETRRRRGKVPGVRPEWRDGSTS